jgi:tetratricopeptide (TPR) repeat protein
MASIFLSYDHDDAARAAPIASALAAHGHSVWWDREIHGGAEYNSAIENAVETSDAVVVLWSQNSVRSAWVRDEAGEGRDRGRLVPVLIERVKPPMGFRQYQTLDLSDWAGGKRIPRLPELLHAIDRVAGSRASDEAPIPRSAPPKRPSLARAAPVSRRAVLGAGAAAAAAAAGGGIWLLTRSREDPRFTAIMEQAQRSANDWNASEISEKDLEQAVAIMPGSAKAWGFLALLRAVNAQGADPRTGERLIQQSRQAAQRALSIDADEPNALLAMFELQGATLDWITRDQRLRQILAIDPKNVGAISELTLLTQATGMCRESWDWNERAVNLAPLNPEFLGRRALKLWILGRLGTADQVSDQVRSLYPDAWWGWFVRVQIYAFTGRAAAAAAILDSEPGGPSPLASLWRATLPALENPSPAALAKARDACIHGAESSAQLASQGVQIMSAAGDLETAFAIAEGALLSVGPIVLHERSGSNAAENGAWRASTQWMFTPATDRMRPDPRFLRICDGIGLTDYWRKRGVKPDYMNAKA